MKAKAVKNRPTTGPFDVPDKRFKNTTRSRGYAAFDQNKPLQSTIPAPPRRATIKV
jgi:hypothetical protein